MKKMGLKKTWIIGTGALLVIVIFTALGLNHHSIQTLLNPKFNDCPYIFYEQDKVVVKWVEAGLLIEKSYFNDEFTELDIKSCEDFEAKYLRLNPTIESNYQQNFKGVSKIAILSDIHGQHDLFIKLLQANNIIDAQRNWSYGVGHFVLVGDVFDRGNQVTETLWFLYKLEQQAAKSGGKVHLLLGNHEIMVLKGDLRYVSEKYEWISDQIGLPYDELFGTATLMGEWLRTKPVAISINDIAFSHAGFSPQFANKGFDIELTNKLFHERIIDHEKSSISNNDTLTFMVKSDGPIWYRGYFKDDTFTKEKAEEILDAMGMTNIVVGHTSMDKVISHYDGLIYSVDSSIKKGDSGEILFWEDGVFSRGTLEGDRMDF